MATPQSRKSRRRFIIGIIVLLLAGGVVGGIYYKKRAQPIKVQTDKVTRRNLIELVNANGKIQPVLQVVINPEVSGEIVELPVKEGQAVKKGDLLVSIKPDNYEASRNSAKANYLSGIASKNLAYANLQKAEIEFKRYERLFKDLLVSDSQFLEAKTTLDVMKATYETSCHQVDQVKAALAKAEDDLSKTTIRSPIVGTVTKLKSQIGERVVGTALMAGTEIMTVADLTEMEARIDIGEVDIVLLALGQTARLDIDSFPDRKFTGKVTEIANASKTAGQQNAQGGGGGQQQQQEATKFEVKIHVTDKGQFRPGMSVTADIETRYRTNVLTVPIQSVTTRAPKPKEEAKPEKVEDRELERTDIKKREKPGKPQEVVFLVDGNSVKKAPVKRGISDAEYVEIVEGLQEGQVIISGGYKAINRELDEGKKIVIDNNTEKKEGT